MVTMPPEVVRIRASSTVLVNASRRVNLDLTGILTIRRSDAPGAQKRHRSSSKRPKHQSIIELDGWL